MLFRGKGPVASPRPPWQGTSASQPSGLLVPKGPQRRGEAMADEKQEEVAESYLKMGSRGRELLCEVY